MIEMCQQKNIKMEFRLISKYLLARRIALSFIVCSLIIFGEKGIHAQKNKADKIFLGGDIITVDDKTGYGEVPSFVISLCHNAQWNRANFYLTHT